MTAYRIRYTRQAERDIDAILDFIADRSFEDRAMDYVSRMRAKFRLLADAGFAGHPASDLKYGLRKYVFEEHTAVLHSAGGTIYVLHIFGSAQDIRDRLRRRT